VGSDVGVQLLFCGGGSRSGCGYGSGFQVSGRDKEGCEEVEV